MCNALDNGQNRRNQLHQKLVLFVFDFAHFHGHRFGTAHFWLFLFIWLVQCRSDFSPVHLLKRVLSLKSVALTRNMTAPVIIPSHLKYIFAGITLFSHEATKSLVEFFLRIKRTTVLKPQINRLKFCDTCAAKVARFHVGHHLC